MEHLLSKGSCYDQVLLKQMQFGKLLAQNLSFTSCTPSGLYFTSFFHLLLEAVQLFCVKKKLPVTERTYLRFCSWKRIVHEWFLVFVLSHLQLFISFLSTGQFSSQCIHTESKQIIICELTNGIKQRLLQSHQLDQALYVVGNFSGELKSNLACAVTDVVCCSRLSIFNFWVVYSVSYFYGYAAGIIARIMWAFLRPLTQL